MAFPRQHPASKEDGADQTRPENGGGDRLRGTLPTARSATAPLLWRRPSAALFLPFPRRLFPASCAFPFTSDRALRRLAPSAARGACHLPPGWVPCVSPARVSLLPAVERPAGPHQQPSVHPRHAGSSPAQQHTPQRRVPSVMKANVQTPRPLTP